MDASSGGVASAQEDDLVLAMPRRELYAVRGLCTQVQLAVIQSLAEESWYAAPSVLAENDDAKEVRIGILVRRGGDYLVEESGVLLHTAPIPAAVGRLGEGLAGIRRWAQLVAQELLRGSEPMRLSATLIGYLNEDIMVELRPFVVLVYEIRVPETTQAEDGLTWVGARHVQELPLEAASLLTVDHCSHA